MTSRSLSQLAAIQTTVMVLLSVTSVGLLIVLLLRVFGQSPQPAAVAEPQQQPPPAVEPEVVENTPTPPPQDVARTDESGVEARGPLAPLVGAWQTGTPGEPGWSRSTFRPLLGGAFIEHRLWGELGDPPAEALLSQTIYRYDDTTGEIIADGYARNGTTSRRPVETDIPVGLSESATAFVSYSTQETTEDLIEIRQEIVIDPAQPDTYRWRVFSSPLGQLEWQPVAEFVYTRLDPASN